MKCLITGARGFVGSHLVEHLLKNTDWDIIIFDKLSYSSIHKDRLTDIEIWEHEKHRVDFYSVDLTLPIPEGIKKEVGKVDYILHLAAESHVDRSIDEPRPFILNNVAATITMLDYAREIKPKLFVNFSTDEVYGPAPGTEGSDGVHELVAKYPALKPMRSSMDIVNYGYPEFFYHHPSNPYSASKSAQEAIGIAYSNTYSVPVVTTHTMNIFGERQHPEKFVPMVIKKVLAGEEVTIHADKTKTKAGTRFYLHARNLADALLHIISKGYEGYDEWNIAGLEEVDNLTLAQKIAQVVGKELKYKMVDFHSSRPGHDLRYALDSSKLINSGFNYAYDLKRSIGTTTNWYLDNKEWLDAKTLL